MPAATTERSTAILMLLLANFFWGVSFPLVKALGMTHALIDPSASGLFLTVSTVAPRFFLATAAMALLLRGSLGSLTRGEVWLGLRLGLFVSGGMLLQNEGLRHTEASTSAFLTQLYAVLIPLWHAARTRRNPGWWVWLATVLVLLGVAILGRLDWTRFSLGWGETATLLCSLFFMGQILSLDETGDAPRDPLRVNFILFLTQAVIFGLLGIAFAPSPASLWLPWTNGPWVLMTCGLTLFCTLIAFSLMTKWQPKITSTEAGLIYCIEPVFGSLMAIYLPAWLSVLAGIHYANETAGFALWVGGGLITAANIVIQLKPVRR